jgi:endoglucanase
MTAAACQLLKGSPRSGPFSAVAIGGTPFPHFQSLMKASVPAALLLLALVSAGCSGTNPLAAGGNHPRVDPFEMNRQLGRGVNFGNALEAPREGEWGVTLDVLHFRRAAEAGFATIRLPVRWSAHAQTAAPYRIDETFFRRVDWAIDQALANDLNVVVNVHHYEEMATAPQAHRARWLAIWRQVAERYRDRPANVLFELMNEPHGELGAPLWNQFVRDALVVIRQTNPVRTVVVGPVSWNSIDALDRLSLPASDSNLIATVHFYDPFQFTHQDASWVDGSAAWLGTEWPGTTSEKAAITERLERAAAWGQARRRPIFLGEFGAYSAADMGSRARWTEYVAREAERLQMSWAYWEFMSGFGLYVSGEDRWIDPLKDALLPD